MNEVIPPFSMEIGEMLFNDLCAGCHGMDGEGLEAFDTDGISLNTVALANPVEFMHKIRMGQPGTFMPSMVDLGFDTDDAKDVLAYAQMGLVPGGGCCEIAQNDCEDGQTLEQCNALGGELHEEICAEVPECNVAPPGTGCCVIAENDCEDDQTLAECEDLEGIQFDEGFMCSAVDECNVAPPPDGEALYIENCQACHGVDGMGGFAGDVDGKSAEEINQAIANVVEMMGLDFLSAEEVDAIAEFLAP
jgi:mono/diheme cytochrome c family protein